MKWIVLAFLCSQVAFAGSFEKTSQESCTQVDLRNEKLPRIRDQKEVSWCYAFTAADMLAYTYNLPEMVSAADVAINYNSTDLAVLMRRLRQTFGSRRDQDDRDVFMMAHQTGFNKIALDRAMRDGFCPERVFPSESWVKMTKDGDKWSETNVDLKSAMLEIYGLIKNQKKYNAATLPFYFHFKNVESVEDFYKLIKGKSPASFYSSLRDEVCKYDRIKFRRRFKNRMHLKNSSMFIAINKQINRNRLVGIDYDARILSNRNNDRVSLSLHTSSIVGRRWNDSAKACQYLVRDSHGNQCSRYDSTYECLGGQVWLSESLLYPNLTSFVYTEKE